MFIYITSRLQLGFLTWSLAELTTPKYLIKFFPSLIFLKTFAVLWFTNFHQLCSKTHVERHLSIGFTSFISFANNMGYLQFCLEADRLGQGWATSPVGGPDVGK